MLSTFEVLVLKLLMHLLNNLAKGGLNTEEKGVIDEVRRAVKL